MLPGSGAMEIEMKIITYISLAGERKFHIAVPWKTNFRKLLQKSRADAAPGTPVQVIVPDELSSPARDWAFNVYARLEFEPDHRASVEAALELGVMLSDVLSRR